MLSSDLISETIKELENSDTNITNCQKLASLYIILDHYSENSDKVKDELNDISPQYKDYVKVKCKYQKGKATITDVDNEFDKLCKEIREFIQVLYATSESTTERKALKTVLTSLINGMK